MWIQSTIDISREDAIDKALKIFSEKWRKNFIWLTDEELEDYIDETYYNYRITN